MFRERHGNAASYWPWTYARNSQVTGRLPGPGSGNLVYTTLGLPFETPIGDGNANLSQWIFQMSVEWAPHLVGLQGLGGLQNQHQYSSGGPLVVTQPTSNNQSGTTTVYYPG